jgi:hypothetical protein
MISNCFKERLGYNLNIKSEKDILPDCLLSKKLKSEAVILFIWSNLSPENAYINSDKEIWEYPADKLSK